MTLRIHGNDHLEVGPLKEGATDCGRRGVCEIGLVINLKVLNCQCGRCYEPLREPVAI